MGFFSRLAAKVTGKEGNVPLYLPAPSLGLLVSKEDKDRTLIPGLDSKPATDIFTDLIVNQSDSWGVPDIQNALLSHEQGIFVGSSLLADFMLRDDRVASSLNTRILGLMGLPFEVEPGDEKDPKSVEVAEAMKEDWPWIFPEEILSQIVRWAIIEGFCLCEVVWNTYGKRWVPTLKVWHPQYIYYRLDLRKYVAICMEGNIAIEPGDGKWFLYAPHGMYRGWMNGVVRSLAVPFLLRQYAYRDWARYDEVHGAPIRGARVPMNASVKDKMTFYNQISNLGAKGTLLLPKNMNGEEFNLELIEAMNQNSWQAFQNLILRCDASIDLSILGQNLSGGEIKGGSFAAAKVADGVRDDFKLADARGLGSALAWQVARPYAKYNFGNDRLMSKPTWDASPPEDQSKSAETFKTVAEGAQIFWNMGVELDLPALAEKYTLPIKPAKALAPPPVVGQLPALVPTKELPARLSRGPSPMDHVVDGQLYTDAVVDRGVAKGVTALADVVDVVTHAIKRARDFDELKLLLLHSFKDLDTDEFEKLVEGAAKLALGAGAFAVRKEGETE